VARFVLTHARMSLRLSALPLQHTLGRAVTCQGVGLHGGAPVRVRIRPSHRRPGIVFRRVDLEAGSGARVEIAASLEGVTRVDHATTLSANGASVGTVEHLVAALHGCGIDACIVEVDGPEIPILDGSSAPWIALLRRAGTAPLPRARKQLRVLRPKTVSAGESSVSCYPAASFRVSCAIDFTHPAIGHQEIAVDVTPASFERELAAARTFGFLRDVEAMRAAGLARGGSLENAIVLDETGVMNGPLRFADEFVRHKALDLVGDLALAGLPLAGHFVARRASHRLHVDLARTLLADPSAYVVESAGADAQLAAPGMMAELAMPAARTLAD
jgi:UDP-3-O-[3-hydroxymyristoyl] N-acetylglucosamine deacetylase